MLISISILIFATSAAVFWLFLLGSVTQEDWITAAKCTISNKLTAIDKEQRKTVAKEKALSGYTGITACLIKVLHKGSSGKKVSKLHMEIRAIQEGNFKAISMFFMPGFVLMRKYENVGKSVFYKTILSKQNELHGKKHAPYKAKDLLAKMLSYPLIGVALILMIGSVLLSTGHRTVGFATILAGTLLVLVLTYALYDDLNSGVVKRQESIARHFPGAVSKLALLVTSGMIMARAWKETAVSHSSELYLEMKNASDELDNLMSPEAAYGGFISRCNTKETAKLASSIVQNLSKGNAEIGSLLNELAKDAWLERRHSAKRDAERANSKLMIPTMILFISILFMLMVPIAMNFSVL